MDYHNSSEHERHTFAKSIKLYVGSNISRNEPIEEYFILIVTTLASDISFSIRKEACYCLANLLGTNHEGVALSLLDKMVGDTSPNIKYTILSLIEDAIIKNVGFIDDTIKVLKNDASFGIRQRSDEVAQNIK